MRCGAQTSKQELGGQVAPPLGRAEPVEVVGTSSEDASRASAWGGVSDIYNRGENFPLLFYILTFKEDFFLLCTHK